jgi:dimethylargininase
VIAVPLRKVLHLKSAVTALPKERSCRSRRSCRPGCSGAVRPVGEGAGCQVVAQGGDRVLIAASPERPTLPMSVGRTKVHPGS